MPNPILSLGVMMTLLLPSFRAFQSAFACSTRHRIQHLQRLFSTYDNSASGLELSLDDLINDVESLLSDVSQPSNQTDASGWTRIDWNKYCKEPPSTEDRYQLASEQDLRPCRDGRPSPVEHVLVKNRLVYMKRDDLLRLPGSGVSGNKARKMYALNEIPPHEFPECVVSYGGPQSNAMLALAAIVHSKNVDATATTAALLDQNEMNELYATEPDSAAAENHRQTPSSSNTVGSKRKRFVYYTKKLPRFLRTQPNGNFFRAQTLGMELVELSHAEYNDLFGSESGGRPEPPSGLSPPVPGDSLWVPQGGACGVAVPGGRILASEIVSFWKEQGNGKPLSVCVPGGTCTTALLLHREIRRLVESESPLDIRVVVIPCVGDDAYARRQMMALNLETGGRGDAREIPTVLMPSPDSSTYFGQSGQQQRYFSFGEPDADILSTFREMEECGVNLDLLYGAPAWTLLLKHWRTTSDCSDFDEKNPLAGREIMYVHSGGLEGVTSQLTRYRYKGLVELDDVQYPTR